MESEAKRGDRSRFRGFESLPVPIVVCVGRLRLPLSRLSDLKTDDLLLLQREVGRPFDLMAGKQVLATVQLVGSDRGIAFKLVAGRGSDESTD